MAVKNKLEICPQDDDESSYAGASGTKLTVIGQCHMFVNFKDHKMTKELRALVIAEEGDEILVGLDSLISWNIVPSSFPLPMSFSDRAGQSRHELCYVRSVKEHKPERLVSIQERVGSWRTEINFNQALTEEQFESRE